MKPHQPVYIGRFTEELLGQGRFTFTREEAERRLRGKPAAVYMALYRQAKAGRLVMPRSGFYLIVDPQHRAAGTLPPEWFVHELMAHARKPYYVALLSAAQIHGAAHHRPQEFQVMIPRRAIRPVEAGNVRIRFFGKGLFEKADTIQVKTPTGYVNASSPETTAWDLVRYPMAAGGLDNVVTVLSELAERLKAGKLREGLKRHGDVLVAQRLGYLLDRLDRSDLARGFSGMVAEAPIRPLDPSLSVDGATEDRKWHLLVNAEVEPEA